MAELKGSQTEKNLLPAFAGESQARHRYTFAASQARKEGLEAIAAVFEETANHEKEHAKRLFGLLPGGEVTIAAAFPAGVVGTTAHNLREAAAGEHHEHSAMYPEFAAVARQEGFTAAAVLFESIAKAETYHEERFLALLANLEAGQVFQRSEPVVWRCRNCGYSHVGTTAPKAGPACAHPQAYFEIGHTAW